MRQEQDGFSNLILDAELRRQKLEGRDKAFASAIFYTVLEHQGTLDYILCQFLPKGLAKLDAQVREILRAALAQARYMQVPVSAAVNEAVKLTRTFRKIQRIRSGQRRAAPGVDYDLGTAASTTKWSGSWCLALPGGMWRNFSPKLPGRSTGYPYLQGRRRHDQPAGEPAERQRR